MQNSYQTPDVKSYTFAVSDYFTRDMHDKSAAAIAMAMSQIDQEDIWAFCQRLLLEIEKYPDLREERERLEVMYFGNGRVPTIDGPIPMYYLKADAVTENGNVRIRGLVDGGELLEVLPWSTWQHLKKESTIKILRFASKILAKIDLHNNFSAKLAAVLEEIQDDLTITKELYDKDVKSMIETGYIDEKHRDLEHELNDVMTFKRDSPNAENRKYKIFSKDYSYNLQTFVSQVFNSNDFNESMYHLSRTISYLSNTIETKAPKGNIFYVRTKVDLASPFLTLVRHFQFLNDLSNHHQYLTSDERISIYQTLHHTREVLQLCQGKILSLVNYIMTLLPRKRQNVFGRADW